MNPLKYAFMTFSTPDMPLDALLSFAKDAGYDGIEPRVESRHQHGIELETTPGQRKDIRAKAEDARVSLCCIATSIQYLSPANTVEAWLEQTRQYTQLAADIGSPALRVFGGGDGEMDGFAERHVGKLADILNQACAIAEPAGIKLCFETHDYWTDPAVIKQVLDQVDNPAMGVNWDAMHPLRQQGVGPADSYATLKPWIMHGHMHAGYKTEDFFQFVPFGDSRDEFAARDVIEVAMANGFDGCLSGEWLNQWSDPHTELPRELQTARRWEQEILSAQVAV